MSWKTQFKFRLQLVKKCLKKCLNTGLKWIKITPISHYFIRAFSTLVNLHIYWIKIFVFVHFHTLERICWILRFLLPFLVCLLASFFLFCCVFFIDVVFNFILYPFSRSAINCFMLVIWRFCWSWHRKAFLFSPPSSLEPLAFRALLWVEAKLAPAMLPDNTVMKFPSHVPEPKSWYQNIRNECIGNFLIIRFLIFLISWKNV